MAQKATKLSRSVIVHSGQTSDAMPGPNTGEEAARRIDGTGSSPVAKNRKERSMKFYAHPASTVSRPVLQFIADHDLDIEVRIVDIFREEQLGAAFTQKNPNRLIPVLEDGNFLLTESASILRFLAEKIDSKTYPKDLQHRARINERIDWFNSNFYRDWGYGLIYPQVFPTHKRDPEASQVDHIARAHARSAAWLQVLNDHYLRADASYLCGDTLTIADYFGLGILSAGQLIHCDLGDYLNIESWMKKMRALPSYDKTYAAFNMLSDAFKGKHFVRIEPRAAAGAG